MRASHTQSSAATTTNERGWPRTARSTLCLPINEPSSVKRPGSVSPYSAMLSVSDSCLLWPVSDRFSSSALKLRQFTLYLAFYCAAILCKFLYDKSGRTLTKSVYNGPKIFHSSVSCSALRRYYCKAINQMKRKRYLFTEKWDDGALRAELAHKRNVYISCFYPNRSHITKTE